MKHGSSHVSLYLVTTALLVTHEIDSAYWKEWNLFGLPGANQGFLAINFVLVGIALLGFKWLVEGKIIGRFLSFVLALAGLFAVGAHAYFIYLGHMEFREPASIGLLALILVASVLQLRAGFQDLRSPRKNALRPTPPADLPSDLQPTLSDSTIAGK